MATWYARSLFIASPSRLRDFAIAYAYGHRDTTGEFRTTCYCLTTTLSAIPIIGPFSDATRGTDDVFYARCGQLGRYLVGVKSCWLFSRRPRYVVVSLVTASERARKYEEPGLLGVSSSIFCHEGGASKYLSLHPNISPFLTLIAFQHFLQVSSQRRRPGNPVGKMDDCASRSVFDR
jgi:hypothetical protein